MNIITRKELSKVKLADLSNFDESALVYSIPKYTEFHYEQNKCYLIKLNNSITNPSQDSTLASNYNNGKIPEYSYYYVDVLKVVGKLIKVSGIAYDVVNNKNINSIWEGWLPVNEIQVIERK